MAIQSVKNQFRGINPHLHSYWQAMRRWNRFHNAHITYLERFLSAQLLPMGYVAESEESLQIRRLGDEPRLPRADILIADRQRRDLSRQPYVPAAGAQLMALEALVELEEEDREHPYSALAIYELLPDLGRREPVAWIELLSPSNKGGSLDAQAYRAKRSEVLTGGLVFVELDYLHESPPSLASIADYNAHEADAHPFRIILLDPHPSLKEGIAALHQFDVDDPIPTVRIPLRGDDLVEFDFNRPYQQQFEELLYGLSSVDYSRLPLNFDRYSPADQLRIVTRLLTVKHAAERGEDLEQAPLPLIEAPVSLKAALAVLGVG